MDPGYNGQPPCDDHSCLPGLPAGLGSGLPASPAVVVRQHQSSNNLHRGTLPAAHLTRPTPRHLSAVHRAKFRCCTPADEPDACVSNNTSYPGSYQRRRHRRGEDERAFWDVVTQEPAATCRYTTLDDACPPFAALGLPCETLQANW